MLYSVFDLDASHVFQEQYDVAIFASGYEKRCIQVAKHIDKQLIKIPIVLGFKELANDTDRRNNDNYYSKYWTQSQVTLSADDDGEIYACLDNILNSMDGPIKILVDYSSMSRLWYAGIMNWARVVHDDRDITLDMLYSIAEYRSEISSMVINDILSIPGCEGSSIPFNKSVAIFGLGFDEHAPLCVLDRLEADTVYAYIAEPAAFKEYPAIAKEKNKELIKQAKQTLSLPLKSIENTFRYLAEIAVPHMADSNIICIPMGPKPHILAAILLAMRFQNIACLRVSGSRPKSTDITATGEIVATRVKFKPDNESAMESTKESSLCG